MKGENGAGIRLQGEHVYVVEFVPVGLVFGKEGLPYHRLEAWDVFVECGHLRSSAPVALLLTERCCAVASHLVLRRWLPKPAVNIIFNRLVHGPVVKLIAKASMAHGETPKVAYVIE